MESGVVKSFKQPRLILISGVATEAALIGTVETVVCPLAEGPVKTRSVILKGNDTASQGPGMSLTRVVSEPVGIVAFRFDDPQEVRNVRAKRAISTVVPVHVTIPSRLLRLLLPSTKRLKYIAHRLDNEVGPEFELARRAWAVRQGADHFLRTALRGLTDDPTNRLLPDPSACNSSLR